jgi:hypothetical protein
VLPVGTTLGELDGIEETDGDTDSSVESLMAEGVADGRYDGATLVLGRLLGISLGI